MGDINFTLDDNVHTALKVAAAKSGMFVKDIIAEAVKNHKLVKFELDGAR